MLHLSQWPNCNKCDGELELEPYIVHDNGLFSCLLCLKYELNIHNAISHFNSPRHGRKVYAYKQHQLATAPMNTNLMKKFDNRVKIFDYIQTINKQIQYLPWKMNILSLSVQFLKDETYCVTNIFQPLFKYMQLEKVAIVGIVLMRSFSLSLSKDDQEGNKNARHIAGFEKLTIETKTTNKTRSHVVIPLILQYAGIGTIRILSLADIANLKFHLIQNTGQFEKVLYGEVHICKLPLL
jgi:hypothetical protein